MIKMNNFNQQVLRTLGRDLQAEVHANSITKGFWPGNPYDMSRDDDETLLAQKLALVHSEVSEALEVLREASAHVQVGKFGEELADVVIRVMDIAEYVGVDLMTAIVVKHAHNATRPRKHGKRF